MFCSNCGKEISDGAVICPHCGCIVKKVKADYGSLSIMSIIGFVVSIVGAFFISFWWGLFIEGAALAVSIIGVKDAIKTGKKLKGLGIAGIVISAIEILVTIILIIVAISLLASLY